jgi:ketosteroid isomerase-like protein
MSITDRATANRAVIEDMYAAFGRGDIEAIIAKMHPDCAWEQWERSNSAQDGGYEIMKARTGREGVMEFFGEVAKHEITYFQALDFLASDRQVVVEVEIENKLSTGGKLRDEELHLYTVDEDGLITRMRHYVDTAKHLRAWAGEDTTAG